MNDTKTSVKDLLKKNGYTCIVLKDGFCFCSNKRGVSPLISLYDKKGIQSGAYVADKVVGKAAAFIYALLDVKYVFCEVISVAALEVLERYGIDSDFEECVPAISNRDNTDVCPMEKAVLNIGDPYSALDAIRKKQIELKSLKK